MIPNATRFVSGTMTFHIIVGVLKRGEYSTLILSAVMVGCLLYSTRGTLSDPDGCLQIARQHFSKEDVASRP